MALDSRVASLLDGVRLEPRELKARSTLLGACTTCPLLRSDLEAAVIDIKDLKHGLDHPSCYSVLSPPCELCDSFKGKLFHAIKENTELQQEVPYLTARLQKTALSKKMTEENLSRVEESATKSTYKLGVGFERCEDKGEKSAPKFIPSSTYHQEEKTIKSTKSHDTSNPKQKLLCACFVAVSITCMSFASGVRELRRGVLIMLETHIVMSPLIFCLVLILVFYLTLTLVLHLALLLMPYLISLMDLIITHMVLVHERTALSLDALVMAHVLIVVIVSHVSLIFLLEGLTLTLNRDTWTVHIFPVMAHVPLSQMVRCK
jgi:cation transport ATPase